VKYGNGSGEFEDGHFLKSPMCLDLKIPIVIDIGFGEKGQRIPSVHNHQEP
jgi:hypothetical protein